MNLLLLFAALVVCEVGGETTTKEEPKVSCFDDHLAYKGNPTWIKTLSPCTESKQEILKFCQTSYPTLDISNIVQLDQDVWRCLESPFQSDALLVPAPCIFDHIHNSSVCQGALEWNETARDACGGRTMHLNSYSVLLPCGVGLFTGVEFVCCPAATELPTTPDPYYSKYNVRGEHDNYLEAEERLETRHRGRMEKVMKDWNGLESRYQEMRADDVERAEKYKKMVTERFQKTIKALENEGEAEKKQLISIHQQRVHTHLNEKRKEALECFSNAIQERPQNGQKVRKCGEKLMRILHKSRHHVVSHFKHLMKEDEKAGEAELDTTLQRLEQISNTARETLQKMDRFPNLKDFKSEVEDYVNSLAGADEPKGLLEADRESDAELLGRKFAVIPEFLSSTSTSSPSSSSSSSSPTTSATTEPSQNPISSSTQEILRLLPPKLSHSEKFELSHESSSYVVRREVFHKENRTVYITMAFAGLAVFGAMVVGLYVLRRRGSPRGRGFLQVSVGTPEEKHVANMQINGYENPTYKYFETKE